jgi:putative endonuclease
MGPCVRRDDKNACITFTFSPADVTAPLYIGVTNSLAKRLEQHRNGEGSSFVKTYGVYRLVYVESYERAEEAIAREKQLKRWKRDWKIEMIERENLEWRDLSDLIV